MFLVNYVPSDREPTGKPHRNMSVISTAVPLDEVRNKDLLAIGASILQVVFVGLGIFIFMIGKAKYKMLEPSGKSPKSFNDSFTKPVQGKKMFRFLKSQKYELKLTIWVICE